MKKELIAIVAGAAALTGCGVMDHFQLGDGLAGSGVAKSETRTVGSFNRIELSGSTNVEWKKGASQKITVKCDDNLLSHLITEVKGDSLKIYFDVDTMNRSEAIVEIVSPTLVGATVTGSGDLRANGIQAAKFVAAVTGSGDLTVIGSAESASINVTGSGSVDGGNLNVETAKASVTGSGDIFIHAAKSLNANILGSGNIEYVGTPVVDKAIQGSGDVRAK